MRMRTRPTVDMVQVCLMLEDDSPTLLVMVSPADADDAYTVWQTGPADLLEAIRYAKAYAVAHHMEYIPAIANCL